MKKTKKISVSALMAALCVVIMALGSLIESLDFSLAILAGLPILILSVEYGNRFAISVFAAAGLLALLLPVRSPAILFLAFFGWYPVAQKKIRFLRRPLAWTVRLVLFNVIMAALLAGSAWITGTGEAVWIYAATAVFGNICFVMYDYLLERFLIWYEIRLRSHLRF